MGGMCTCDKCVAERAAIREGQLHRASFSPWRNAGWQGVDWNGHARTFPGRAPTERRPSDERYPDIRMGFGRPEL